MSDKPQEDVGRPATDEENRADALAAAPEKDELQLKREAVADAGLAHGSLNNYKPDEAEAAIAGEEGDLDARPGQEAGNATEGSNTNPSTGVEDEGGQGGEGSDSSDLSKVDKLDELKAIAEKEQVDVSGLNSKAEVREAIEAKRAES